MSNPYVGEIRVFGFTFAPRDWAFCNGQLIGIAQNSTLFAVIGTTFGGDGQTTFGLPNLQDKAAMHWGSGPGLTPRNLADAVGSPTVTLMQSHLPPHTHQFFAATPGNPTQSVAA